MAISVTEVFRRYPNNLDPKTAQIFASGVDPLSPPGLHLVNETADSKRINMIRGGAIIMAGSGMATGGRIRHHLRHNLWRSDAGVIFVGFAAQGTLARLIVDGAKSVHLFGEEIPVKAKIYTINGFSAHAGQTELLAWQRASQAARTFLVHGEEPVMQTFGGLLSATEVVMPKLNESFDL